MLISVHRKGTNDELDEKLSSGPERHPTMTTNALLCAFKCSLVQLGHVGRMSGPILKSYILSLLAIPHVRSSISRSLARSAALMTSASRIS